MVYLVMHYYVLQATGGRGLLGRRDDAALGHIVVGVVVGIIVGRRPLSCATGVVVGGVIIVVGILRVGSRRQRHGLEPI